jgi:hypothetical protein
MKAKADAFRHNEGFDELTEAGMRTDHRDP